jgi:hypothetical protein
MLVRDLLKLMQSDDSKIHVVGRYKLGLVDLYVGEARKLRKIVMIHDIIEQQNWGGLDPEKCFLLREVDSIDSSENGEIKVSVQMPDSYDHRDKAGNPLTATL